MEHNIDWDEDCECFVWWLNGTGTCLFADSTVDAQKEVDGYLAEGKTPDTMIIDEYNDDMDGDHDSAMASIGWGTDEDYGFFGGSDDY